MQQSESVAGLERLADAFAALVPDAPGLMVDRETGAPANAIGWSGRRNFRVRLRQCPAAGQASAYYRLGEAGLELMVARSGSGPGAQPVSDNGAADGVWGSARVRPGEETETARLMLRRLRRQVR